MDALLELPPLPKFSTLGKEYLPEIGKWKLTRPLIYFHNTGAIVVPAGFVCDEDSVPRVPIVYALFKGRAVQSAWVHDYLYRIQAGKAAADRIFLDAMKDEGLPAYVRYPIYWAVVYCGDSSYQQYATKA